MGTTDICDLCGMSLASHDYDAAGDVIDCTGEAYAEHLLAETLKAAQRAAELFASEFPGEVCEQTDWDSTAFATDWPEIARGGSAAEQYYERCWLAYRDALARETRRLAAA